MQTDPLKKLRAKADELLANQSTQQDSLLTEDQQNSLTKLRAKADGLLKKKEDTPESLVSGDQSGPQGTIMGELAKAYHATTDEKLKEGYLEQMRIQADVVPDAPKEDLYGDSMGELMKTRDENLRDRRVSDSNESIKSKSDRLGVTEKVYKKDKERQYSANLNEDLKREYDLIEQIDDEKALYKSVSRDNPLYEQVKDSIDSKIQGLQKELHSYRTTRKNDNAQAVEELVRQKKATPSKEEKKAIQSDIDAIVLEDKKVFGQAEDLIIKYVEEGKIDMPDFEEDPEKVMSDLFHAMVQQKEDLEENMKPVLGGAVGEFLHETVGNDRESRELKLINELENDIELLAPVVLLNKYPDVKRQEGLGGLWNATKSTFGRWTNSNLGPAIGPKAAIDLMDEFEQANVIDQVQNSSELLSSARWNPQKQRFDGPDFWSAEKGGELLGMVGALIPEMYVAGAVQGGAYQQLGSTGSALFALGKGAKGGIKASNYFLNAGKLGQKLSTQKWLSKAIDFSVKGGANMFNTGVRYEIGGQLFKNADEELNFGTGMLGSVGRGIAQQGGSYVLNKLSPLFSKFFGKGTPDAIKKIAAYGKGMGKVHSAGVGETFEEVSQELYQIYKRSNGDFLKQAQAQFGDMGDLGEFAFTTYLMGMSFGLGEMGNSFRESAYINNLSNIKNPEERAAVEKAVEALDKEFSNAVNNSVETKKEVENGTKPANTQTEQGTNTNEENSTGAGKAGGKSNGETETTGDQGKGNVSNGSDKTASLINELTTSVTTEEGRKALSKGLSNVMSGKAVKKANKLLKTFGSSTGVNNLQFVANVEDIVTILKSKGQEVSTDEAPVAFRHGGQIVIDLSRVQTNTVFHEFFHPALDIIKQENKEVYAAIAAKAKGIKRGEINLKTGKVSFESYGDYANRNYKKDTDSTKENEAITEYLADLADNKDFQNSKDFKGKFKSLARDIANYFGGSTEKIDLAKTPEQIIEQLTNAMSKGRAIDVGANKNVDQNGDIQAQYTSQYDTRTPEQVAKEKETEAVYKEEIENKFIKQGNNYVFKHYAHAPKQNLGSRSGEGSLKTSRDETSAMNSVGGVTLFYTEEGVSEPGTGNYLHEIAIPKDKVYVFNSDADGFYFEAKKRFNEKFPGQGFSPNHQVAWITKVANENGYDMVVAAWKGNQWRGQTTMPLAPSRVEDQLNPKGEIQYQKVDGKDRSTTNSDGEPLFNTKEGIENFWRWFGESKAVDEDGRPIKVYHGSPDGSIEAFDRSKKKSPSSGLREYGTFFGTNENLASIYSSKTLLDSERKKIDLQLFQLKDVQTRSRNVKEYDGFAERIQKLERLKEGKIYEAYLKLETMEEFHAHGKQGMAAWDNLKVDVGYDIKTNRPAMEALAGENNASPESKVDGVKAIDISDVSDFAEGDVVSHVRGDVFLVFDDANIKSANENSGAFDANDNRIQYQMDPKYPNEGYEVGTDRVQYQATDLRDNAMLIKEFGIDPTERNTIRQIGEALDQRQAKKFKSYDLDDYSDKTSDAISDYMVDEVLFEVLADDQSNTATGWYTEQFQESMDLLSEEVPELKYQPYRDLFTMTMAITSDGQKVQSNFNFALKMVASVAKGEKIDIDAITYGGKSNTSMKINAANINALIDQFDGDMSAARVWLLEEDTIENFRIKMREEGIPKKEVDKFGSGYKVDMMLPRAAGLFGPKLGAFWANLAGATGYLTMDRWWTRTFNRYRGHVLPSIPGLKGDQMYNGKPKGLYAFKVKLGTPNITDNKALKLVEKHAISYKNKNWKNGTDVEKSANTLYKRAFSELNDAPQNGSDREFMINTTKKAQQKLTDKGYDISIADIQAILWYFEKRLFNELGGKTTDDISYKQAASKALEGEAIEGFNANSILDPDGRVIDLEEVRSIYDYANAIKKVNNVQYQNSDISAAPYRSTAVSGIDEANRIDQTQSISEYKSRGMEWAAMLGLDIESFSSNLGGYKNSWEYSVTPNVDGDAAAIRMFSTLFGIMGPEIQESVVVSTVDEKGSSENMKIKVDPDQAQNLLDNLHKYDVGAFSYRLKENDLYLYDIQGDENLDIEGLLADEKGKIQKTDRYKAKVEFIEEKDYVAEIGRFRDSGYYRGVKGEDLDNLLDTAEAKVAGQIQYSRISDNEGRVLNRTAKRMSSVQDLDLKDLRMDILINPEKYSIDRTTFLDANALIDEMSIEEQEKMFNESATQSYTLNRPAVKDLPVLVGSRLMSKAAADHDQKKVREIFDKLWRIGSHAGLILRHMAELKGTTAMSVVSMVEAQLNKLQKGLKPRLGEKLKLEKLALDWELSNSSLHDLKSQLTGALDGEFDVDLVTKLSTEIEEMWKTRETYYVALNRQMNSMMPMKPRLLFAQILQGNLLTLASINVNIWANIWYNVLPMRPAMEFVSDIYEWTFENKKKNIRNYRDGNNFYLTVNGGVFGVDYDTWYDNEEYWSNKDKNIQEKHRKKAESLSRSELEQAIRDNTFVFSTIKGKSVAAWLKGRTGESKLKELYIRQQTFLTKARNLNAFPFTFDVVKGMTWGGFSGVAEGVKATIDQSVITDLIKKTTGTDIRANEALQLSNMQKFELKQRFAPILAWKQLLNDYIVDGNINPNAKKRAQEAVNNMTDSEVREYFTGDGEKSTEKIEVLREKRFKIERDIRKKLPVNENGKTPPTIVMGKMLEGTVGINADIMFRLLALGDVPFRNMAELAQAKRIGQKHGITSKEEFKALSKNFTTKEKALIQRAGDQATFADDRTLSLLATQAMGGLGKVYDGWGITGDVMALITKAVIPFVRIPANLLQSLVELALPVISLAGVAHYHNKDRRKAGEHLSKVMLSAGLYTVAGMLYENNVLIGEPRDDKDKQRQDRKYDSPNSINVSRLWRLMNGLEDDPNLYLPGDETWEFQKAGIIGMFMAYYVKLRETLEGDNKEFGLNFDTVAATPMSAVAAILPMSFLANVFQTIQSITDGEGSWVGNILVTQSNVFIPNNWTSFQRARREEVLSSKASNGWQTLRNQMALRMYSNPEKGVSFGLSGDLLGDSESIYPIVDDFGQDIPMTPEGQNAYFYHMFSPARSRKLNPAIADIRSEMINVAEEPTRSGREADYSLFPSKTSKDKIQLSHKSFKNYEGDRVDLSIILDKGDEYLRMKMQGSFFRIGLHKIMFDENGDIKSSWKKSNNTRKIEKIKDESRYASERATYIMQMKLRKAIDEGLITVDQENQTYVWVVPQDHLLRTSQDDWDTLGNDGQAVTKRANEEKKPGNQ